MKILIITSYTIPDYAGGGRNAWGFANYLTRINIPNIILTFNRNLKYRWYEKINGVQIRRLTYFNYNHITKLLSFLFFIWPGYFYQALKSDLIYIIGANIIGYQGFIWLGSRLGKNVVFRSTLMGFDDMETLLEESRFKFFFKNTTLAGINVYLSINPYFTKSLEKAGVHPRKVIEISQGVDADLFKPVSLEKRNSLRDKYAIPSESFLFISVGHIIKRKGFDQIFDHLSRIELDFFYLVVGETEFAKGHFMSAYRTETIKLIEYGKSKLGGKLRFMGPQAGTIEFYQMADVFLLGSYTEGTPNVLLEAMSCGLPVICRELEGISDFLIFNGKNGHFFNDFKSFKNAFLNLYQNTDRCKSFGSISRDIIKKYHSFKVLHQKIIRQ